MADTLTLTCPCGAANVRPLPYSMVEPDQCDVCGASFRSDPAPDPAAVSDRQAGEGWQPIETAPRDREVLIFAEETGEMFVAFWGTDPEDGDQQWVFARSPSVSFIVRAPTHWMALPAPPSSTETGEQAG